MTLVRAAWRLINQLREAFGNFTQDDGFRLAAAVSYYAALSLFPLLLILTAAAGLVFKWSGWGKNAEDAIIDAVRDQASPQLAERVGEMLSQVQSEASIGGPVGLVTLLVAAVVIFAQFEQAFNRIWNVEQKEGGGILKTIKSAAWDRLKAFGMLVSVGAVVLVAFVADLVLSTVASRASDLVFIGSTPWTLMQVAVAMALNWLAFTILFRVLPKAPVRWSEAARGGLLVAIVWEIGRRLIAAFLIADKYSAYGLIGSFIALMLWVYCGAVIIFLGAEYVQVVCRGCQNGDSQEKARPLSNKAQRQRPARQHA